MGADDYISGDFYPERILIVQFRQVGDALMCTPAIRALRREFPDSRIDFLAEPPAAKALEANPHLDDIIVSNPRDGWDAPLRLLSRIRGRRYDLVIDYLANPRSAVITMLSGAKITLSYGGRKRSGMYKHTVMPEGDYSARQKLSLLRALGIENNDLRPEFHVLESVKGRMDEWLHGVGFKPDKPFILIDPTHRRVTRRYNRYAEVAHILGDRLGMKCVFVWGPGEEDDVGAILREAGEGHLLAPRTDLQELGALISRAALLLGNDSAPRHIAAALGTPTVTVIGSTRVENWTLPEPIHRTVVMDIECRPCSSNKCKRDEVECMTRLEPEKVVSEIQGVIP